MSDTDRDLDSAAADKPMARRVGRVLLGSSLVAVGVPMLVLPGPGLLSIAAGVSLVASEVPSVQAGVDRLTRRIRS
ncbi:MAG: hypothetical protein HKN01_05640 [Acidimicrobiia bacterium]|nr:hypothetical protein [Acidimicrobiia bacterium]